MTRTYYKPISDWCVSHGIALCGHPHGPQNIKLLESFGIPGQDIVWRWVAPENDLAGKVCVGRGEVYRRAP